MALFFSDRKGTHALSSSWGDGGYVAWQELCSSVEDDE